jgi:hypothetical protein
MTELPAWDYDDEPEGIHALRAIVGELAQLYVNRDPRFRDTYHRFSADRTAGNSWRSACLELLVLLGDTVVEDGQHSRARLRQNVSYARELVLEELQ